MNAIEFRSHLLQRAMSQSTFAEKAGLAPSTVHRWATDKQPIPGWVDWVIYLLQNQRPSVIELVLPVEPPVEPDDPMEIEAQLAYEAIMRGETPP